jgi:hypothetical protein
LVERAKQCLRLDAQTLKLAPDAPQIRIRTKGTQDAQRIAVDGGTEEGTASQHMGEERVSRSKGREEVANDIENAVDGPCKWSSAHG